VPTHGPPGGFEVLDSRRRHKNLKPTSHDMHLGELRGVAR
jgi:hypothetical protein